MARTRRVAITGAGGQLGRALAATFGARHDVDLLTRNTVILTDWRSIRDRLAAFQPDLVIHAAAVTDVDGCESDVLNAYAVNALGTRHVAQATAALDAELVYISTNYVFSGDKTSAYHEFDDVGPINVYGASKLAGEVEARAATARCHVVRTSWLYSHDGRNFAQTMQRLMQEREQITVVDDQIGNPTYVVDLAVAITHILNNTPYGVHHVTNTGATSWHGWATEIARITGSTCRIEPISAAEWPRAATPPANGELISLSLRGANIELPDWRDALHRCLTT